jgi:replicative DNA helicase
MSLAMEQLERPATKANVPYSLEAEQAVLGALMLDNRSFDQIVDVISDTDFYRPEHKLIYQSMYYLMDRSQPIDTLTVIERLLSIKELPKAGGEAYIFELANNTPSASNILAYAQIVRERSILRQLIHAASDISKAALNPDGMDAADLLDKAEQGVFAISQNQIRGSGPVQLSSVLTGALSKVQLLSDNKISLTGMSTGFSDLDKLTHGFHKSDLIIVAARPSMGKTVFGMNIAEYVANTYKDKPVLIFSLEMPSDAIVLRMLASLSRIELNKLRTGQLSDDEWSRLRHTTEILSTANMYIDDTPALSPSEMRARARRVARMHGGLSLIMIDYLQLMQLKGYKENRTNEVSEISRSLKALAKEMDVPVIALSQLNRSLEMRQDKRPIMSDLRESGAIEQDADLIAFIYRDEVYHEDTPDRGIGEIIIAKHRNGAIGRIRLKFHGQYTRFDNLAHSQSYNAPFEN